MNVLLVVHLLILLGAANGAPLFARILFGKFAAHTLDRGIVLADGKPLLGPTKTIRGIVASLLATVIAAVLVGQPATLGIAVSLAAMAGDAISSFVKRRLGFPSSSMALALDQIPESLLPLLAVQFWLTTTLVEAAVVLFIFFIADLLVCQILIWLDRRKPS